MQKSGETVEFVYNENGLRVQKTATSTGVTKYTLHGKNIVHMTQGSNNLHFFYDASNKPAMVVYNGVKYAYVHNLQGDIVAILDSNGTAVVQYKYDAWGRPISCSGSMASTLGTVQPFRYRGYVYDEEMGLYYLRSRYYKPEWCRFLNPDSGLFSKNVYSYCNNQVIGYVDTDGYKSRPPKELNGYLETFQAYDWGIHETKVPASMVIANAITMVQEGDWKYVYGSMKYKKEYGKMKKEVDCMSITIISAKFHMTEETYEVTFAIRNWTHGAITNNTLLGVTTPIGDYSELKPGVTLFNADESHAGIYIGYYNDGKGTVYEHAVIQAQSDGEKRVIVHALEGSSFVSYAEMDYIEFDLTYEDTLITNNFSIE